MHSLGRGHSLVHSRNGRKNRRRDREGIDDSDGTCTHRYDWSDATDSGTSGTSGTDSSDDSGDGYSGYSGYDREFHGMQRPQNWNGGVTERAVPFASIVASPPTQPALPSPLQIRRVTVPNIEALPLQSLMDVLHGRSRSSRDTPLPPPPSMPTASPMPSMPTAVPSADWEVEC
jgi:hypothetical protein